MAWDDEFSGEGRVKRTIRAASGQGTVFLYRVVVGVMTTLCATMSGLILNGFIDQGKELSALIAMQPQTEKRLVSIESTIVNHTSQIDAATSQEKIDAALVQNQIQQILLRLDRQNTDSSSRLDAIQQAVTDTQSHLKDQDQKLVNLGVAVARLRGASQPK